MDARRTAVGDRFTPTNPCLRGILNLFSDEKTADVVFEVDGGETFHAHRLILSACAPALAEYCDAVEASQDGAAPMPIAGVEPEIFRSVLYYVYGGTIPEQVFRKSSKDIIDAADRFGIGNLKVEAEGWYVESTPITLSNFMDNFHFSDTKKCALPKERVMDFLVQNETKVLDKLSKSKNAPQSESMLADFLTASARKKRKRNENDRDLKTMSVDILRRELDKRGLDVDGTREILISALEKCYPTDGAFVEGAGTTEANGIYTRQGTCDGVPKYVKSAKFLGRDVEFTLFRCMVNVFSDRRWYISMVPPNENPGTSRDTDFYFVRSGPDDDLPPRGGWIAMGEPSFLPSPTVYANHADDSETGESEADDSET